MPMSGSELMPMSKRVIVSLDIGYMEALRLVDRLGERCSVYKLGQHSFYEAWFGELCKRLMVLGKQIMMDPKLADVGPSTHAGVLKLLGMGAKFITVGADADVIEVAVGLGGVKILVVTMLTSKHITPHNEHIWAGNVYQAIKGGAAGVVCSGNDDINFIRKIAPKRFFVVCPGIRLTNNGRLFNPGAHNRWATPKEAIKNGADYIVVGSEIIKANDPVVAFDLIVEDMES